jgi:hypothetical protein
VNNTCIPKEYYIDICDDYDPATLQCMTISPIPHCQEYYQVSTTENICIQCKEGYFMDFTLGCLDNELYVLDCEKYEQSIEPDLSITYVGVKCVPGFTIRPLAYSTKQICVQLNKIISGCDSYDEEKECVSCQSTKDMLFYHEDTAYCVNPKVINSNCIHYTKIGSEIQCTHCEPPYVLQTSPTVTCVIEQVSNCAEQKDEVCISCSENYILRRKKNKCEHISKQIPNCSSMDSETQECTGCTSLYGLKSGQCFDKCIATINFCVSCWEDGTNSRCAECEMGYLLNTKLNVCELICLDVNCSFCDEGGCWNCFEGFELNSKQQCVKKEFCSDCYVDPVEQMMNLCKKTDNYCENCDPSNTENCKICKEGFVLGENGC